MTQESERDYVLGTHDEEIARLALQHRVWRPRALAAWQRAGFTVGQTLLDVGCGPGHAAVDLAGIVGPTGRVVAIDRSRRFLDFLEATRGHLHLGSIETLERDLDRDSLPEIGADGAWVRWVFSFVRDRRGLVARLARALRPGGTLVLHEYGDYRSWRYTPRSPVLERFVLEVMASWRESGGEPDVGFELPGWLAGEGFEVLSLEPIVHVVRPSHFVWQWAAAFLATGPARLVELGRMTHEQAAEIAAAHAELAANPHAWVETPLVTEIIARRR